MLKGTTGNCRTKSVSSSTMCLRFRIHCHTELGQCKFLWIQEVDWVRSQMTNPLWVMKSIKVKFAWGISGSQNDCGPKNIHLLLTYWLHLPRFFLFLRHFHLEMRLWAISSSSTDCLFSPCAQVLYWVSSWIPSKISAWFSVYAFPFWMLLLRGNMLSPSIHLFSFYQLSSKAVKAPRW